MYEYDIRKYVDSHTVGDDVSAGALEKWMLRVDTTLDMLKNLRNEDSIKLTALKQILSETLSKFETLLATCRDQNEVIKSLNEVTAALTVTNLELRDRVEALEKLVKGDKDSDE